MDQLRSAEAEFRVSRGADAIPGVVDAAVALLVAGEDTPNLRILAGEDHASPREVEQVLDATLRDLGMEPLDQRSAVLAVARALAGRAIANEGTARALAPLLWRLFAGQSLETGWPDAFSRLVYAADAVEDLPEARDVVPEFMAAARDFLAEP